MNETHLKVLKVLEENPSISQRRLADELGVSLGKTNYCLRALLDKGLIKAKNFKNNQNKIAYAYLLTPKGIEEKAAMTLQFLKRKMHEYERLKTEIEKLQSELRGSGNT